MLTRLIRLLEHNEKTSGLWYICELHKQRIDKHFTSNELNLDEIISFAKKLKIIRNKIHFHLDKNAILDPKNYWNNANITWEFLEKCISSLDLIFKDLYKDEYNEEYITYGYEGRELDLIYDVCKKSGKYAEIFMPCVYHR